MVTLNNKGVTLISLVIMITVILILAGVTIYYSNDTVEDAKKNIGISKIQLIQEKVNVIHQKILNGDSNYIDESGTIIIGQNVDDITDSEITAQINRVLTNLNISQISQYKYFDTTNINQLELDNIEDKILINFNTREVILVDGIEYEGNIYYRLEDISDIVYNVAYENKNTIVPEFSVITQYLANSCKIIIQDIQYSDYINSGKVSYKLQEDTDWIRINGTEFEVTKPGIYDIKLVDSAGNEATKKAYVYVFEDLLLCLDASQNLRTGYNNTTDVWQDLSINNNDIKLNNFDGSQTSGWQENYLFFDGVDDYAKSVNVIDYNETKKLTVQIVDLNGQLYNNEETVILLENSTNYENNNESFLVHMNANGTKNFTFSTNYSGYNLKYKDNSIRNETTSYTAVLSTINQPNEFIDIYVNNKKQEDLSDNGDNIDITNMTIKNYELFIGARNGATHFTTMNLSNLRIYKTALTEEEININYQIDKARYNIERGED